VHYETLESYGFGLENAVDLGWSIISPVSKITLSMLVWLHQFISNYGIVIIILSVFVKIILFPLTYKSMKATQGMQQIQPQMEALREKHKNDSQKLNKEMMKLYKEGGVNPLGGCLPMVLQMPILFSLYTVFSSTIELRDAPFIDAWINDLSLKDPIYVLPVLMGLTMLLQSKMTMKDPRQAMFIYVMPIVLFFIMKDLPSGLILYWTMVNILTIIQQYIQNRFLPISPATT
jgi:YidC/Oxa1 family membrane protein insertase